VIASQKLLQLYFIRHGETAWSLSGHHTGHTDIPLTAHGEYEARGLEPCFRAIEFETGLPGCAGRIRRSSPIGRYAMETAGHRVPCDSRRSCTVLGAPGGEIPSGDSTQAVYLNPRLSVATFKLTF